MNKSINDLQAQVERVLVLVEERGGWRNAHGYDEQTLWQIARSIAARRGLSYFDDKDKKGVWTADMFRIKTEQRRVVEIPTTYKNVPQIEKKPKEVDIAEYERKLNAACDEQMMCKVLAWVAQSIMLRTKLGVEGDPLEIPRRLYAEMQRIIGKRTQGVLF